MQYTTPAEVEQVKECLAKGMTIPETVKATGLCRWVVNEVKQGRHRLRYRNPKRYATQDAWKKRLTPEERKKLMPRTMRCSCGLLIRTKTCRRCAVVKGGAV